MPKLKIRNSLFKLDDQKWQDKNRVHTQSIIKSQSFYFLFLKFLLLKKAVYKGLTVSSRTTLTTAQHCQQLSSLATNQQTSTTSFSAMHTQLFASIVFLLCLVAMFLGSVAYAAKDKGGDKIIISAGGGGGGGGTDYQFSESRAVVKLYLNKI